MSPTCQRKTLPTRTVGAGLATVPLATTSTTSAAAWIGIARAQEQASGGLGKLQETVAKGLEGATERGYVIRRIEDRLTDLQARFAVVEANYVKAADHEKELAPFRKWGSWIAMLVIGGVVTAIMALVLGKGGH